MKAVKYPVNIKAPGAAMKRMRKKALMWQQWI